MPRRVIALRFALFGSAALDGNLSALRALAGSSIEADVRATRRERADGGDDDATDSSNGGDD